MDSKGRSWPHFMSTEAMELFLLACEKGIFLSFTNYYEGPEKSDIACQLIECKEQMMPQRMMKELGRITDSINYGPLIRGSKKHQAPLIY